MAFSNLDSCWINSERGVSMAEYPPHLGHLHCIDVSAPLYINHITGLLVRLPASPLWSIPQKGSRPGRVRYHRVWSCWPMCQENSVLEEGIFYWRQNKSDDTMTGLFRSAGGPPRSWQSASCPHDRPRWGRLRRTDLKNNTNIRKI